MTWALIGLNVLVFLLEVSRPEAALQTFIQAWGVVPREYAAARDLAPLIAAPFWSTLFTSMFLHGGWMHLLTRVGITHVPALLVLGFWVFLQVINGVGSIARTDETAGVAYMAHLGGFVAGLALVKLFATGARQRYVNGGRLHRSSRFDE